MAKQTDLRKVVRQLSEVDDFFAGFSIQSQLRTISMPSSEIMTSVASQDDLISVAQEVAQCTRCILGGTRKNPVPGEGNPRARLVFVGEAPGGDEEDPLSAVRVSCSTK